MDGIEGNGLVISDKLQQDLKHLSAEIDVEEFEKCLDLAIKYLVQPKVLPEHHKVAATITQLSAYALIFRAQFANYMGFLKGTKDANAKKNAYKEMYQGIDNLVDSMKYLAK